MAELFRNRYLPINVALLIIAGLYSFEIKSTILKWIYFIWRVCGLIICTVFIVWITAGLIESGSLELERSAPAILHLSVYITTWYLIVYFYVKRKQLDRMLSFMENDFSYTSEEGVHKISMHNFVKGSQYITAFWCCWIPFAVGGVTLVPIVTEGYLPIDVWCFYKCYTTPAYEITMFIQLFAQYVVAVVFLATNILFPSFANVAVGQFRVLGCNYKNLLFTALLKFGVSRDRVLLYSQNFGAAYCEYSKQNTGGYKNLNNQIDAIIESEVFDKVLLQIFTEYIQRHQKLLKYIEDMDDFFSKYFILKLPMYITYSVLVLYLAFMGSDRSFAAISIMYLLGSIMPTFFFNYFGQLFVDEYSDISLNLYKCPWYVGSTHFQKAVLFVHMAASRKIVLTAGKIINMNMDTFKGFIKFLMSFVTLIRKLSGRG